MSRRTFLSAKGTSIFLKGPYSYLCPSCAHRRALLVRRGIQTTTSTADLFSKQNDGLSLLPSIPHVPTPTPVTAVNAPPSTPLAFRKLDQALRNLEKNATVYINTSQLRLVLRGLESTAPVTRIAILGLGSWQGAARLARVLLVDPLAQESEWEKRLAEFGNGNGKTLLLRYGETYKVDDGNPLVETLSVPSKLLQDHKIEILIQRTRVEDGSTSLKGLFVPSLETTGSYGGRPSLVTYPVHKVLVYADGLGDLPIFGNTRIPGAMLQRVVDGTWTSLQTGEERAPSVLPVNLSLSEKAIGTIRMSLEKAIEYEHAWFDSGLPGVASWLSAGTESSSTELNPAVRRLIEAHSLNTAQAIRNEETLQLKEAKASEVPMATRNTIEAAITTWAENAHTELRDRLNGAFLSKSWGKTTWWKLFWRVDEVSFTALNILSRAWLVDAEKEMIWISGRIQQSGLLGPPEESLTPNTAVIDEKKGSFLEFNRKQGLRDVMDEAKPIEPDEKEQIVLHPWPQNIPLARTTLSVTTVAPLHSLAQTLTLQTVSTTFLTSTLSALIYVSVSSSTVYEAGAIAAAGLVLSLRRLQKRWERAREEWTMGIREEGAEELRNVEQLLRDTVNQGGEVKFDFDADRRRRIARKALEEVRDALDEIPVKEK